MARRQARGVETRERIMSVALEQFGEKGFASVSIEGIAAAAGVTKGAVYYWFTDKNDLARDLQHELYEHLTTLSLQGLDPKGDVVTNMRQAFDVYLEALGSLGTARFFLRDAWMIPELDEAGRSDHRDAVSFVEQLLARGMERQEIIDLDPSALAAVLLGALAEATLHVLTTGERDQTVAVVIHLIESLRLDPEHPQLTTAMTGNKGEQ
ncbi:MAG: TetR family transcriptional regulator [Actinobacteria bacterium]|jgi:AcrR family transcriptional regulator|uniref:Unannotated protein n=1 Tax=freshwater metagenome TaxID=449393 RepID=A0A6J7R1U0_9ZZZZ|nr:TetR family transcriptional regulator [Actinomycetota bacterium]MSX10380.1 TetR family transcriptional regulator [Actinomycetota bacterium]